MRRPLSTFSLVAALSAAYTSAQSLTDAQLLAVRQRGAQVARLSWENGTRAQTLIECDTEDFDVLSTNATVPPGHAAPASLAVPLQLASIAVRNKPPQIEPLMVDGSAADPASLGVAVLIANWTGQRDTDYSAAAASQLDYLLNKVNRTSAGAISHRNDKVQLWADFIYMVPPFLAYYGALHGNRTLMDEAYTQISLYRDQLRDPSANNLWKHIVMGNTGQDPGHWATGNGWAAMGMLRVMGTFRASTKALDYQAKQETLATWVEEILEGMYNLTRNAPSALFRNYPDNPNTFYDGASTALVAAATYRLALLTNGGSIAHIPDAERARKELSKYAGDAGGHIDGDGWLYPVADPHNGWRQGNHSADGQSFVLSMYAGYRAWSALGQPNVRASAAVREAEAVYCCTTLLLAVLTLIFVL